MKILIVHFSRTGYTRGVADRLAELLHGTSLPITEAGSRLGFLGYQRCLVEAVFGIDAAIEGPAVHPARFDLVVLGTPIWGWHLSSPVRTFARRHAPSIRRCAFFCTMGGSGASTAFAELERLVGRAPEATLALTDREIDSGAAVAKIESFAAALRPGARRQASQRKA
jgi:menaquinone-dependent protoporphyrinogen IX oxidase